MKSEKILPKRMAGSTEWAILFPIGSAFLALVDLSVQSDAFVILSGKLKEQRETNKFLSARILRLVSLRSGPVRFRLPDFFFFSKSQQKQRPAPWAVCAHREKKFKRQKRPVFDTSS